MKARRSVLIQIFALALAIGMSLLALPFLDRNVPIHFGLDGRPDAWGSPAFALALTPLVIVGVLGGTFGLLRSRGTPPKGIFGALALTAVFFLGEHALLLGAVLRGIFPVRMLLALAFGLFFGLAPILARVDQNPWFGVRTPWTLGSRRVWRDTHRATGRLWLVGGGVGSVFTVFGGPLLLSVAFLIVLAVVPIGISYSVWRKAGRP